MTGQLLHSNIMSKSTQRYSNRGIEEIQWLDNLKESCWGFLNDIENEDFSYFKYSYSGDLFTNTNNWGLANSVYATKILYISKLLDRLTHQQKENIYQKIKVFFQKNGYIYDPVLTQFSLKNQVKRVLGKMSSRAIQYQEEVRRAETRQSFAALYLIGKRPHQPFLGIPYSEASIDQYLSQLNWSTPWAAGSHFSHLLFFLRMNAELFGYQEAVSSKLIQYAVQWINNIQNKQDGAWYVGTDVSLPQKINGAMKILTGLHAANIDKFNYANQLVDTALSGVNDSEACSNFNIVYVLYACHKVVPNYRKTEIVEFLLKRIELYRQFYYPNYGGFSFHRNKANDKLYGKVITAGKDEPDIHGTVMFVWGLSLINQMIDLGLDFEVPIN